jgi:hypothetical protein
MEQARRLAGLLSAPEERHAPSDREFANLLQVTGFLEVADIRLTEKTRKRHASFGWSATTQYMPCGRLALRAYVPTRSAKWEQHWREAKVGELPKKFNAIVRDLKASIPAIMQQAEEAQKQAEIESQRREAEWREYRRREEERRRAEAFKESRQQLLLIVEHWALARNIESFFEDAERRATDLPPKEQESVKARLQTARKTLGGTNALDHFGQWKAPEER